MFIKEYIEKVFWIQNQIKLKHWQEPTSGFQHEKLGVFYDEISEKLDELVEASIAVYGVDIVYISDATFKLDNDAGSLDLTDMILKILLEFRSFFESSQQFGLVNIVDDVSSLTLKYKYLFRLN